MNMTELSVYIGITGAEEETTLLNFLKGYNGDNIIRTAYGLVIELKGRDEEFNELLNGVSEADRYMLMKLRTNGGCIRADLVNPENGQREPLILYMNLRDAIFVFHNNLAPEIQSIIADELANDKLNIKFVGLNELETFLNQMYYTGEIFKGKYKRFC